MKKFSLTQFPLPVRLGLIGAMCASALATASPARADGGDYRHAKTATATSGAATLHNVSGTITSEALTTAAAASYTLTLTCNKMRTDSIVNVEIDNGTNTQGIPVKGVVTPANGSCTIKIWNLHATQALNGTLKIRYNLEP